MLLTKSWHVWRQGYTDALIVDEIVVWPVFHIRIWHQHVHIYTGLFASLKKLMWFPVCKCLNKCFFCLIAWFVYECITWFKRRMIALYHSVIETPIDILTWTFNLYTHWRTTSTDTAHHWRLLSKLIWFWAWLYLGI